jgi:cell division protein FtsZ
MAEMGKAMMGTGEADGENRAIRASEAAISNPLLEDTSMAGARGLLINITGGADMTLYEVDQAANRIREEVDEDANIIFGSAIDPALEGKIRVSVVATGIDSPAASAQRPRLVAVGGGAPMMVEAEAPAEGGYGGGPPMMAEGNGAQPGYVAFRNPARAAGVGYAEAQPAQGFVPAGGALPRVPAERTPMAPEAAPAPQQMQRSGLFGEAQARPPAPPQAPRGSLFSIVTDVFRRAPPEASLMPQAPVERQPAVRAVSAEEGAAIDIPAFLRRQSN